MLSWTKTQRSTILSSISTLLTVMWIPIKAVKSVDVVNKGWDPSHDQSVKHNGLQSGQALIYFWQEESGC